MKKIKKYIYPFIFSVIFLILYLFLLFLLSEVIPFPNGSYAPAAWAALFTLVWILFVLPFYCVKYSKIIIDEKLKFLFSVYNCIVIVIIHPLPFNLQGEENIVIAFLVWVIFCNVLPLIIRLVARQNTKNTAENEAEL